MAREPRKEPLTLARHEFERWAARQWPTCPPPAGAWVAWSTAWEMRGSKMRRLFKRAISRLAQPADDGWIEHDGNGDPPLANPWIEVRFKDGDTAIGRPYDWDQNWEWVDPSDHSPGTITHYRRLQFHYRVVEPPPPSSVV